MHRDLLEEKAVAENYAEKFRLIVAAFPFDFFFFQEI